MELENEHILRIRVDKNISAFQEKEEVS